MLKVEQNYLNGIPQTILPNFLALGIGWHWDAGAGGRAGWEGTVRYLINTRYTVNASYHGGFWPEHKAGHVGCVTVIQWIVRTTNAAHSVNPAQCWQYHATKPRALQDARFAETRRILGAKAADPNAGMLALAYAGMPDDLDRDLACPVFREDLEDLAQQLIDHPTVIDRPHFGHGWIQPVSRYEMDTARNFIGLLYGDDMAVLTRPVRELWKIPSGSDFWTGGPALGEQKWFTANVELWSNGETLDGLWRRIEYGDEELWMLRAGKTPVPGSRNPATGFGTPTLSVQGIKPESWTALQQQAVTALKNIGVRANADADAIAAKKP